MPVLVTGASGFLGGRLVELLAERGDRVVALVRPSSNVDHLRPLVEGGQVLVARAELAFDLAARDLAPGLREAFAGVRQVYHCAGCSTDWASARTYNNGNVLSTQAMLAAAAEAPELERFVHVSTTDVYGYPLVACDESGPLVDTGLGYNHSKIQGEEAVWRAFEAGMPLTVVRPATIYGPRGTAFVTDVAKLLRERMMAYVDGGRAPGGFVYVDDVCGAMLAAAACPAAKGEAYNLSSVAGETWRQYCVALAAALGLREPWINLPFGVAMGVAGIMEAPQRFLGARGRPLLTKHAVYLLGRDQEFSSGKAWEHFGWMPKVGLDEGVRRSAEWLLSVAAKGSW